MTFSAPVESLNAISTELREAESQMPKHLKELAIRAADAIDDLQRKADDYAGAINLVRGFMVEWSARLEASSAVRIGMMDSDARASEKLLEAQRTVQDVTRLMREVAARS